MLRTRIVIAVVLLAPLGPALGRVTPPPQQQASPLERLPNVDSKNAYPRWLQYTSVTDEEPSRHRVAIHSLDADSRGAVHVVTGDDLSTRRILHHSDVTPGRGPSGFSRKGEIVEELDPQSPDTFSEADIAVGPDD